jgi:hypothetical protein
MTSLQHKAIPPDIEHRWGEYSRAEASSHKVSVF